MGYVTDPTTGLRCYDLTHRWGHGVPVYPGRDEVQMKRNVTHAQFGVLAWKFSSSLHTGTHMNAPLHTTQCAKDMAAVSLERCFGNGVVVDLPKGSFETITAEDLQNATPSISKGDIVVINTEWHHKYSDAQEYFGEAPGLTIDAAEWLVSMEVRLVAVDTPFIDCPLATTMGPHRGGPKMRRLADEYKLRTGKDAKTEHPIFYAAHKTLSAADIPTIEQVGGDVDDVSGTHVTLAALPWKIKKGDASPIRFVALVDPIGTCRIDAGNDET